MNDGVPQAASRPRTGFTLVEVLLVMLITSILVLGLNSTYRQAYRLWLGIESQRPVYRISRQIVECLRTDLSGAYLPPVDDEDHAFSLSTYADGTRELIFYTLAPVWRGGLECAHGARVRYRFTKGAIPDETRLERFEQPCAGEQTMGEEVGDVLLTGPFAFSVWTVDPGASPSGPSEKTSYESRDRTPRAVKIHLQWSAGREPTLSFETLLRVHCEGGIQGGSSD